MPTMTFAFKSLRNKILCWSLFVMKQEKLESNKMRPKLDKSSNKRQRQYERVATRDQIGER